VTDVRKILFTGFALVLAAAPAAFAGRIFGDIKMDGKPLPAGVPVQITVPAAGEAEKPKDKPAAKPVWADSTSTDKFGSYKLTVKEDGKCTLQIVYEKQPASLEVFSYKEATRYDLILEKKEGKLALRRK
jgi:hypothetical protein